MDFCVLLPPINIRNTRAHPCVVGQANTCGHQPITVSVERSCCFGQGSPATALERCFACKTETNRTLHAARTHTESSINSNISSDAYSWIVGKGSYILFVFDMCCCELTQMQERRAITIAKQLGINNCLLIRNFYLDPKCSHSSDDDTIFNFKAFCVSLKILYRSICHK